jgi:membrane protease YdiL (CAAX protease family)
VALLGPGAFWSAVGGLYVLFGGQWSAMQPGLLDLTVGEVALFFVILLATDGLGEEAGWRGFALPEWLTRNGALAASLGVGLLWALWHVPLLVTDGAALDRTPLAFLLLDLPATSVAYTWLFLRSRRSAFLAAILHAALSLWAPEAVTAGTAGQLAFVLAAKWLLVVMILLTGLEPTARRKGQRRPRATSERRALGSSGGADGPRSP